MGGGGGGGGGAGMAPGWEHFPLTNVARGSIPGLGVIRGLNLLLVLVLVSIGYSPGTPVFPSKPNTSKYQFDLESVFN